MLKSYPQKLSTGSSLVVDNFELQNIQVNSRSATRTFKSYLTNTICFTSSFRAAVAVRSGRTLTHSGALCAIAAIVTIGIAPNAEASMNSDHYKLYLHSKIIDYKQFICAIEVGHRESRWNPYSRNKNHFGLFQMENKQVQYMNPYTQIDWWIRYVHKRYDGNYCNSLAHLKKRGWQ